MAVFSNMDGPRDCHPEWSQSDRGEILYDTPYMCNLRRNDTNALTKQRETGRLRERTCGCLYTLLHLKRITNKVLACAIQDLLYVAHGTLLNVMFQLGWENGYIHVYG